MEDAEGPFNVGKELDVKQTAELLKTCEEASKLVTTAATAAKNACSKSKQKVITFGKDAKDKVLEGLKAFEERQKEVTTKVVAFEKSTKERQKDARMSEATQTTEELEKGAEEVAEAAKIFEKEGADDMSEEA